MSSSVESNTVKDLVDDVKGFLQIQLPALVDMAKETIGKWIAELCTWGKTAIEKVKNALEPTLNDVKTFSEDILTRVKGWGQDVANKAQVYWNTSPA